MEGRCQKFVMTVFQYFVSKVNSIVSKVNTIMNTNQCFEPEKFYDSFSCFVSKVNYIMITNKYISLAQTAFMFQWFSISMLIRAMEQ